MAKRSIVLGETAMSIAPPSLGVRAIGHGKAFSVGVNGLKVTAKKPAIEEAEAAADDLRVIERGAQFAIGDLYNLCKELYGDEMWNVFSAEQGWSLSTLSGYAWVAKSVPQHVRRMDRLGIKHHQLVAGLPVPLQQKWLTKAAADNDPEPWTAAQLKAALQAGEELYAQAWWVVVACEDERDQQALMNKLAADGRGVKAQTKYGKRKKAKEREEAAREQDGAGAAAAG